LARHDIVVIGTSSGGVEALIRLFRDLPEDLPAAVFVVVHFPQGASSVLPSILNHAGSLKAVNPEDGDAIKNGRVYVAPPNFHLLVEYGRVRLGGGPRENRHRLAADPLVRSAALAYGPRVVGVILTDARDEGSAGLLAVKRRGGVAIVQDPDDALFPGMPESALRYVDVGHCVPLDKIAPLLDCVTREEAKEEGAYPVPDGMELESKLAGLAPPP
jgi:two-component system chemotaxis response regulator CheB